MRPGGNPPDGRVAMLTAFAAGNGVDLAPDEAALRAATWIDLSTASEAEIGLVERATGLHVPSLANLSEIENSSRLATVGEALYLSMPWLVGVAGGAPRTSVLGFVLTRDRVITVRFGESQVMRTFVEHLPGRFGGSCGSVHVFAGLLEAIVDRFADMLEEIGANLDHASATIFDTRTGTGHRPRMEDRKLRVLLRAVGQAGDTVSRLRDSLLAVGRIIHYVATTAEAWVPSDLHARLHTLRQDVQSLMEHDGFLTNKIQFLLDATLGFISIAQNNIIKVLTVVSVVGVPPTLVASIYGMNFKTMPELEWAYGYPYGLAMIVLSAVVPLVWFRLRGWL